MELDLKTLIEIIVKFYKIFNEFWKENHKIKIPNLKKIQINEIDDNIIQVINEYRGLINKSTYLFFALNTLELNAKITTRVKAQNSIQYKIANYISNHEDGKVPIKKCINDLFGIRIVLEERIEVKEIKEYINNLGIKDVINIKCIDSSKGEYKATHIYFHTDNYTFPWELQVWCKEDEKANLESHSKYKQGYTKWEEENKGGVDNG